MLLWLRVECLSHCSQLQQSTPMARVVHWRVVHWRVGTQLSDKSKDFTHKCAGFVNPKTQKQSQPTWAFSTEFHSSTKLPLHFAPTAPPACAHFNVCTK